MANEEEFRKLAEDVKALVRSFVDDVTSEAFRHGLKSAAREAKRGVRSGWAYPPPPPVAGRRGCGPWSHRYWTPPPPPPSSPGTTPGAPAGGGQAPPSQNSGQNWPGQNWPGRSWARQTATGSPWPGPPWAHYYRPLRSRTPPPPVRRRWDATVVATTLIGLFGTAGLLGALQVMHVSTEAVAAIGLMFVGAAVAVTARTDWSLSRRAWPVVLGAGLILVLVATSSMVH